MHAHVLVLATAVAAVVLVATLAAPMPWLRCALMRSAPWNAGRGAAGGGGGGGGARWRLGSSSEGFAEQRPVSMLSAAGATIVDTLGCEMRGHRFSSPWLVKDPRIAVDPGQGAPDASASSCLLLGDAMSLLSDASSCVARPDTPKWANPLKRMQLRAESVGQVQRCVMRAPPGTDAAALAALDADMLVRAAEMVVANSQVTLYVQCDFRGTSVSRGAGRYSMDDIDMSDVAVASIRVPPGLVVTLYSEPGFSGEELEFFGDTSCIVEGAIERVSSFEVRRARAGESGGGGERAVTLYADCDFSGASVARVPGSYDMNDMGLPNDSISSLRVPRGLMVSLYQDSGFSGPRRDVYADVRCLDGDDDDTWNDNVSSFHVRTSLSSSVATFYMDCDLRGRWMSREAGRYNVEDIGLPNDSISSVRVPRGLVVTLYVETDGGPRRDLYSNARCLTGEWNDSVSTVEVRAAPRAVALYADCDFFGEPVALGPGRYDIDQMGIPNDAISSFHVPQGMAITAYQDSGFQGEARRFTADVLCLPEGWNDAISSLEVHG